MTALIALIRKDIILFLSDRRALLMTLVLPIALAVFFGYITGGNKDDSPAKIVIAISLQDNSAISQKIVQGLKAESSLQVTELALPVAVKQVVEGKLAIAVMIPSGFGAAAQEALFRSDDKPAIHLYYDPSQAAVLAMVKGMLTQQVMQTVTAEMLNGEASVASTEKSVSELEAKAAQADAQPELLEFLKGLKKYQQHQLSENNAASVAATANTAATTKPQQSGMNMPFTTKDQAMLAGDPATAHYNGFAHSFAGMTVQFLLFMAINAGISILEARRTGVWNRLLAAPIGLSTVLLARALSCAMIAMFLMLVIFGFAVLVLHVAIAGSILGFIGIAISFAIMTACFGLLIAAFGKTPEAARGIAVFATLILVALGGAWMPSFLFPAWLQNLTMFVPTRWAVDGFDAMTWRGLSISAAIMPILVQLGFAAVFAVLALWRFNQHQEQK